MNSASKRKQKPYLQIRHFLKDVPGQSVTELAQRLEANRTAISGYLSALEDLGYVTSRKLGPAKVYSNTYRVEET